MKQLTIRKSRDTKDGIKIKSQASNVLCSQKRNIDVMDDGTLGANK